MCRRPAKSERGATAIIVAIALIAVGGFMALALNVGHMMAVRGELQNAADAASLAGVADLGGSDIATLRASLATARTTATTFSGYHETDRDVYVTDPSVCLGQWHFEATIPWFQCISSTTASDATLSDVQVYAINAVQVGAARDASQTGGPVQVFFSNFLGRATADVGASAIAARSGPCQLECAAPLVFATCQLDGLPCGTSSVVMSSATEDNVGFTVYSANQQANGPSIQKLLMVNQDGTWVCKNPYCSSTSSNLSASATAQPEIKIQNGNDLTNTNSAVSVYDSLTCLKGQTVSVGIVDVPCSGTNPQFSGTNPLVGFARITIDDVDPVAKTITMTRDCGPIEPSPTRCLYFGLLSTDRTLVK